MPLRMKSSRGHIGQWSRQVQVLLTLVFIGCEVTSFTLPVPPQNQFLRLNYDKGYGIFLQGRGDRESLQQQPIHNKPFRNNNISLKAESNLWNNIASTVSQTAAVKSSSDVTVKNKFQVNMVTLIRVGLPSLLGAVGAYFVFPWLSLTLASIMNDAGVFAVLSQDSSQFVQNFLTVAGLLFSILVGQTFYFMYQQQESVYYALFQEVTEAKSLLEQVALVCQGRSMYKNVLASINKYVHDDLKQLQADPAVLLSSRPVDDPLEAIMYMTSVGVPGTVYETVRSLRQARANRLGALQQKLPQVHMLLLWILAIIELMSFPLLGAGTQTIGGYNILTVEGCLFGVMTFGIILTLRVVGELWRPAGGAYNVDGVLGVMVRGLENELNARMAGKVFSEKGRAPTMDNTRLKSILEQEYKEKEDMMNQGVDEKSFTMPLKKIFKWVSKKRSS